VRTKTTEKDIEKVVNGTEKTFYDVTESSTADNTDYLLTFAQDEK
jgi:hypothetical protein